MYKYSGLKRKIICDKKIKTCRQLHITLLLMQYYNLCLYNNTVILHVLRIPYDWKTNHRQSMDFFCSIRMTAY